jgi:hypothetical protein
MVTAWKREVCATRTSTPSGMFEVFETSYLFRARARRPSSNGESWTSGPAPWLPRVESLELRASQRKTPSVRREQRSLRGDVGASGLGPSQNEPLISRRSRCNPGDAFGVRTLLHAIAAASSGRVRRVDLTASSWARGGGKGWRPASADATRFIGHSIEVAFARPGSLARILEVTARSGARAPGREATWSTGIASSCGVPGEVQAACERSGRARVALGAVDAPSAIPAGDEPADLHDRRLGAGTGPLGGGPPGSALRGALMVGGPAKPRRRGDWMAIQVAPTAARRHTPTVHQGAPESLREEDDGEVAQPELRPPCPHLERSHPAPLEPRGPCPTARGLGRSSAFFRYRSHSSFVDGRDACLVIVCLPAGCDERDPRHASASSAAADPRVAQQGHMKRRRIREDEPVGLVQIRSCPRLTEQTVERWIGRTSGPSCTWSKRRSWP